MWANLCFGTLVSRAIDKIKIFLLLMKRGGKKAITWIVQWIRLRGSHLLPPPKSRGASEMCCTSSNGVIPCSLPTGWMALCWISRSPVWIVSHWLFLRKGVFFLCVTLARGKPACLFHLARAGQCDTSENSSSFILTSSSWRSPRVGSKVEKVTREGVSSKHLEKRKGLKHQTQSDKVERESKTRMNVLIPKLLPPG